jgi:eukaryotic-like serine/threonine-protein kinase
VSRMVTNEELVVALVAEFPQITDLSLVVTAGQKRVFKGTNQGNYIALKAIFIGPEIDEEGAGDLENADALNAAAARLQREIEILRRCQSEHIVGLAEPAYQELRVGVERHGVYSEQWVSGKDLRALLRDRVLSREETIALGLALCSALEELDRHGYVHRDIKPANIMRRDDGVFLVVDPGMALDRGGFSLTEGGIVPGTPPYVSPEQWNPERKHDLDVRSDMFAVGVVLFEALMQKHPFYENGMSQLAIMTATRSKQPRELSALSSDDKLRGIIIRLLSKNPHSRYRDTSVLRSAFEAAK